MSLKKLRFVMAILLAVSIGGGGAVLTHLAQADEPPPNKADKDHPPTVHELVLSGDKASIVPRLITTEGNIYADWRERDRDNRFYAVSQYDKKTKKFLPPYHAFARQVDSFTGTICALKEAP